MSRAFTREVDDLPPLPLGDRPTSAQPNLVTARGAQMIEGEVERLARAVEEESDPQRLASLKRDYKYWLARRFSMQVVQPKPDGSVGFGVRVTIKRRAKISLVTIVGEDEADPAGGLIAWNSPLAVALEGAEQGEEIEFEIASGGVDKITVLAVD